MEAIWSSETAVFMIRSSVERRMVVFTTRRMEGSFMTFKGFGSPKVTNVRLDSLTAICEAIA
jgi:hypothetical protein